MRLALLLFCLLSGLGAESHSPDFFPLQPGNQWVLEGEGEFNEILNIRVHRSMKIDDVNYYLVSGFAADDVWVRKAPGGEIYVRDLKSGQETILAHLEIGVPAYRTELAGCEQAATPAEAPDSDGRLVMTYEAGQCRDAGLLEERYESAVGLVRRTVQTIRGPVTYTLSYARVGGEVITGIPKEVVLHFDFSHGTDGWLAGFADYSLVNGDLHLLAETRVLPEELGAGDRQGFFLQSMNRSDDMFMFLKKGLHLGDGLKPNQRYQLAFEIGFASNAQSGCMGVGGAPGEGVYLKAGASLDEPVSTIGLGKHLQLNVDKGEQSQGGADAGIAGVIANGEPCNPENPQYVRMRKTYQHSRTLSTDERAQMWLLVGTDSAYEGLTGLYYESVTVRLKEVE